MKWAILALFFSACSTGSSIHQVWSIGANGDFCLTTHAAPVWWSAENWTECIDQQRKVRAVTTNHDDIGLVSASAGAILAAVIGVAAAG